MPDFISRDPVRSGAVDRVRIVRGPWFVWSNSGRLNAAHQAWVLGPQPTLVWQMQSTVSRATTLAYLAITPARRHAMPTLDVGQGDWHLDGSLPGTASRVRMQPPLPTRSERFVRDAVRRSCGALSSWFPDPPSRYGRTTLARLEGCDPHHSDASRLGPMMRLAGALCGMDLPDAPTGPSALVAGLTAEWVAAYG